MGTYLDIEGDPNEVSGTAAIMRAMATTFKTEVTSTLGDINAISAEKPWGNDSFGRGFEETYNYTPEGSESTLREGIADGMDKAGDRLTRVGDGTIRAMTEYQGIDDQNARDITTSGEV